MDVHASDFLTIGLLVILEGLLSADNALVLAILVLGLPRRQQRKALRYGIAGAFAFRIIATLLAVSLLRVVWVKLVGALYLLYLSYKHFFASGGAEERRAIAPARPWLGLTAFWATVVKVELTDIVFAVDSILVAVAMSPKTWVVITGGLLGILTMRLVIGQLLAIVRRYPPLVDGAFIIIAWVGVKLLLEYFRVEGLIDFGVNKWFSFGLIVLIFLASYLYARRLGPVPDPLENEAAEFLRRESREDDTSPQRSRRAQRK
jgi:YkoY family integral membrane protein